MTKLTQDSVVVRETAATHRGREIVAELHARYMTLRLKGTRQSVNISYDDAYENALIREARLKTGR